MSNSSIMSIREIIDAAFGEYDYNIVNFKLIQTILYILAKQLRLLERRVEVDFRTETTPSPASLSITEVKLKAVIPKKKKKSEDTGLPSLAKIKSATSTSFEPSSKSTTDRSATDKTTSKSTTEPSSSLKSIIKSSSDKTTTQSSSDKTTTQSSSDKTTTQSYSGKTTTQSSSDKTKSSDLSSSAKTKSLSMKSSSGLGEEVYTKKFTSKEYHHLLETIEQQRERELRVVNQRADSREEAEKSPTPMASLDSMELQYEKLLVVERVPSQEIKTKTGKVRADRTKHLSIVTQDQFDELAKLVKELQEKFSPVGTAGFPDNIQLMQELRKGASLTDAMAALQLSARLESTEKTLENLMSIMTDFAVRKGIDINTNKEYEEPLETEIIYDAPDISQPSQKSVSHKQSIMSSKIISKGLSNAKYEQPTTVEEDESVSKLKQDRINITEFDDAMQDVYSLMKFVTNVTSKAASNAEDALILAHTIEGKLNSALALDDRMNDLEMLVTEYAEQINTLDTGLSSQMTNYQEQLTQMQHDLEAGLEAMGEAMANTGGDTAAVTELNANFTNLQMDMEFANMRQNDLKENQNLLSTDVQCLWQQIEILRDVKSDRDEVADALRDKAGIADLNGMVTIQQFNAVRGDFEKRIGAAYDKFNNQEIIWQKAIDDLLRELNEKADWVQVASFRDDVNDKLEMLRSRVKTMMDIVGEPRAATLAKQLFRDSACLSCATPANMQMEELNIPALPAFPRDSTRPPTIGAEDTKPKEDGDHGLCYPGRPIPHSRDPRSHICKRYCGGSHTRTTTTMQRAPPEIVITTPQRQITTEVGTDGKVYKTDELKIPQDPCVSCNRPKIVTSEVSDAGNTDVKSQQGFDSDAMVLGFLPRMTMESGVDGVSRTPPLPVDDD